MVEALTNLKNNKTGVGKQDANGSAGVDQYAGLKKFLKGLKGRSGEFSQQPRWGTDWFEQQLADLLAHGFSPTQQAPPQNLFGSLWPIFAPHPPRANGGSSAPLGRAILSLTV